MKFRCAALLAIALLVASACTPQPVTAPPRSGAPTLDDLWNGSAHFVLDKADSGLPMGESDTLIMADGAWWSFVHASAASAGVVDQCGAPVEFPGCVVILRSTDAGNHFDLSTPTCQFACQQCPCDNRIDHVNQQQYPRVVFDGSTYFMVYEHGAFVYLRRSTDGATWSAPELVADTGIWDNWFAPCALEERIGDHPFASPSYDCLAGGPPGLYVDGDAIYIFIAQGQNPAAMGCVVGQKALPAATFQKCIANPLFTGAATYGPLGAPGPAANAHFDFRTISSAEVVAAGGHVYMLFEGVRGPGHGDSGDTQFGLGLARSVTEQINGPWETYPGNPILVDLPGNVGLGHADLVVTETGSFLFTSLDGEIRSRLQLVWKR